MILDVFMWYLNTGPSPEYYKHTITDNPAVVVFTVPIDIVLTHPHWTTPLKRRLISLYYNLKKHPEIAKDIDELNPGIEVFVSEKIPARYFQRIEQVEAIRI